ncbi:MAG TPA: FmdB family zinc ribbon protein [Streptosporangiaceae bacterium]
MPTYQYACTSCGEQTEAVQRFTDDPLTVCPACGGGLRKVFSAVGIVFKGSGFYRTDSRNGSVTSGEKAAAKGDGSGDSSSGDSKKESSGTGSSSSNGSSSDGKSSGSTSSASTKAADKKPAGAGSSS